MKRIILLLLITLFTPICSHAISYNELFGTPGKELALRTIPDGVMIMDESSQNIAIKADNKTIVCTMSIYVIPIKSPELITDVRVRATYNVRPGESIMNMPHRLPDELELLDLKTYYADGTYLPKKTNEYMLYVKKWLNQYCKKIESKHIIIKDSTKYSYSENSNN